MITLSKRYQSTDYDSIFIKFNDPAGGIINDGMEKIKGILSKTELGTMKD